MAPKRVPLSPHAVHLEIRKRPGSTTGSGAPGPTCHYVLTIDELAWVQACREPCKNSLHAIAESDPRGSCSFVRVVDDGEPNIRWWIENDVHRLVRCAVKRRASLAVASNQNACRAPNTGRSRNPGQGASRYHRDVKQIAAALVSSNNSSTAHRHRALHASLCSAGHGGTMYFAFFV
jgi:hypothetical protein